MVEATHIHFQVEKTVMRGCRNGPCESLEVDDLCWCRPETFYQLHAFSDSVLHSTNSLLHCRFYQAFSLRSQPISFPWCSPIPRSYDPLLLLLDHGLNLVSNSGDNVLCIASATLSGSWKKFAPNWKHQIAEPAPSTSDLQPATRDHDGERACLRERQYVRKNKTFGFNSFNIKSACWFLQFKGTTRH